MYVPKEFLVSDPKEIESFLLENNFGTLVTTSDNFEPVATHIPFYISTDGDDLILEGHIARANKQSELLKNGKTVLVIFQGPNAYISSSVYSHENVPTWNYQSIHVYGIVRPLTGKEMNSHLEALVTKHEKGQEKPLDYGSLSPEMLQAYLKELVAFRITSYRIEAAYKLSQNRSEHDFQNIVNELDKDKKNRSIVEAMNRLKK